MTLRLGEGRERSFFPEAMTTLMIRVRKKIGGGEETRKEGDSGTNKGGSRLRDAGGPRTGCGSKRRYLDGGQ
jgi:hypothetical protein